MVIYGPIANFPYKNLQADFQNSICNRITTPLLNEPQLGLFKYSVRLVIVCLYFTGQYTYFNQTTWSKYAI